MISRMVRMNASTLAEPYRWRWSEQYLAKRVCYNSQFDVDQQEGEAFAYA